MTNAAEPITAAQRAQLAALGDAEPDTTDSPEAPATNWATVPGYSARAAHYRVRKEAISLRIDMDVLDWLRRQGPGYQTTINRILRAQMDAATTAR